MFPTTRKENSLQTEVIHPPLVEKHFNKRVRNRGAGVNNPHHAVMYDNPVRIQFAVRLLCTLATISVNYLAFEPAGLLV